MLSVRIVALRTGQGELLEDLKLVKLPINNQNVQIFFAVFIVTSINCVDLSLKIKGVGFPWRDLGNTFQIWNEES